MNNDVNVQNSSQSPFNLKSSKKVTCHSSKKVKHKYRQLCLIRTDVDPKFLSGLGKIQIMRIGIVCIGSERDLPICPV